MEENNMNTQNFNITAIGEVSADKGRFTIQIAEKYRPALRELDGFSHIQVLWWCHHLDKPEYRDETICEKPYKTAPDAVGIFATRSPARPNPIGLTAVPVIRIDHDNGLIIIPYIDADDKTPVIDIKPYHPATERIKEVSVPEWCDHWPKWYEDSATFDWAAEFVNAE